MEQIFSDGTWSDLTTLSDGRVILAYSTPLGELVFKFLDGRDYLRRGYSKWLLHLRTAGSANGHIIAIGQDHETGEALFSVDAGSLTSLGASPGVSPVECIPSGDGWEVFVLRPDRYDVYHVNQYGTHEFERSVSVRTSQGFLQCDGGVVQLADEFRSSVPGLFLPTTDSGYSLGQNGGPDPARLRVYHEGRSAALYTGYAQAPRILVQGDKLYGTSWTTKGVWLGSFSLADIPWGNDEPKPIPPDIEWRASSDSVVDPLPFVRAAATAEKDLGDGKGIFWLRKSDERDDWGEWWHYDKDYIGLLEDRSTAYRMFHSKPTPPMANGMTEKEALSLPLASYTWSPYSLWMPRNIKGSWEQTYHTDYVWYQWEHWENLKITIKGETGYGRYAGHEVFFRQTYRKPDGWEINYFGPTGWRLFEAFDENGALNARSVTANDNQGGAHGPYVESRFTPNYPLVGPDKPKPPKVKMIELEEAKARAGYPIPSDIVDGAINLFRDNLLDRDKIEGPALMSSGAWRYFGQHYYPTADRLKVERGIPGDFAGWGDISWTALQSAKAAYDHDQRPGPGVPEPPLPGNPDSVVQLGAQGKLYVDLAAGGQYVSPAFTGALYALSDNVSDIQQRNFLQSASQLGFEGVRVFAGFLKDRAQTAASARSKLTTFIGDAKSSGLSAIVVAITDSALDPYDIENHVRLTARICAQHDNAILELANEIGHSTQRQLDLPKLYSIARAEFSGLITYGADVNSDELTQDNKYLGAGGSYITAHLRRGTSPGGVPMPWYHEASRLTEISKIRDYFGVPGCSGEPNRVEDKDNPVGFGYLLGAVGAGLGLLSIFHSGAARDVQELTGVQLEAAKSFIEGNADFRGTEPATFINGHWAESPFRGIKWYDPPLGNQAWRIFTFVRGNTARAIITGSPDASRWREAFDTYQNDWQHVRTTIKYGCPVIDLKR